MDSLTQPTRWTREAIDAKLDEIHDSVGGSIPSKERRKLEFLAPVVQHLLDEREALEEKLAALAKLHPDPKPAYRLPDWLGGRDVVMLASSLGDYVDVAIVAPDDNSDESCVISIHRAVLVEIVPPVCGMCGQATQL
jgi:hypothetical protein